MNPVPGWPVADKPTVEEGFRRLLKEFETWLNERALSGNEVRWVDGMMIAHNLYKAIMQDLSGRISESEGTRAAFYSVGLRRLSQALLSPEESKQAEREIIARGGT